MASQVMCLLCILLFLAAAPSLTWPLNTRNETLGWVAYGCTEGTVLAGWAPMGGTNPTHMTA